jgi:hypothetical protein
MLEKDPGHPGAFGVQPWSGLTSLHPSGAVHPVEGLPYAREIEGMSEAQFLSILASSAR